MHRNIRLIHSEVICQFFHEKSVAEDQVVHIDEGQKMTLWKSQSSALPKILCRRMNIFNSNYI